MHPQSEMLRVIMADKDITKRSVITECFPNSKLLICLFHTLRSFKREISSKALNLKEGQQGEDNLNKTAIAVMIG